jgi:hypothetical protein
MLSNPGCIVPWLPEKQIDSMMAEETDPIIQQRQKDF